MNGSLERRVALVAEVHRIMGLAPVLQASDIPLAGGPTSTDGVMLRLLSLPPIEHTVLLWGTVRSKFHGVHWVACSRSTLVNTVALVARALDGGASINAARDAQHLSEARSLGLRVLAARLHLETELRWEDV